MNKVEEYLMRERLLKENGEPDDSIFGVKMYKNKKAEKFLRSIIKRRVPGKMTTGKH